MRFFCCIRGEYARVGGSGEYARVSVPGEYARVRGFGGNTPGFAYLGNTHGLACLGDTSGFCLLLRLLAGKPLGPAWGVVWKAWAGSPAALEFEKTITK